MDFNAFKLGLGKLFSVKNKSQKAKGNGIIQIMNDPDNAAKLIEKLKELSTFQEQTTASDSISELQQEILEKIDSASVSYLLARALALAKKLNSEKDVEWIKKELGGYSLPNESIPVGSHISNSFPVYRKLNTNYQVGFQGNSGHFDSLELKGTVLFPHSAVEIEEIMRGAKGKHIIFKLPVPKTWKKLIKKEKKYNIKLTSDTVPHIVDANEFTTLLGGIRRRITDFILENK